MAEKRGQNSTSRNGESKTTGWVKNPSQQPMKPAKGVNNGVVRHPNAKARR